MDKFVKEQLQMRNQPHSGDLVENIVQIINAWNSIHKDTYEVWTMPWNGGTCLYPERCRTGMYIPRFNCNHEGDCHEDEDDCHEDDCPSLTTSNESKSKKKIKTECSDKTECIHYREAGNLCIHGGKESIYIEEDPPIFDFPEFEGIEKVQIVHAKDDPSCEWKNTCSLKFIKNLGNNNILVENGLQTQFIIPANAIVSFS